MGFSAQSIAASLETPTLASLPPLSKGQEEGILKAIGLLPQLLRHGFNVASKTADSTLPAAGNGRPAAVAPDQSRQVACHRSSENVVF
jgi:hypothetical protein